MSLGLCDADGGRRDGDRAGGGWHAAGLSWRRNTDRSAPGSRWFRAGYVGVAGFLGLEATSREGGASSSLDASDDDQGTTRTILAAYAVAVSVAPAVRQVRSPQLPGVAGPVGLALEVAGLALRAWSMRTLGAVYSRTLRTDGDQPVMDTGPYRLVRHPGYAGSLLTWTGFAFTSGSLPVVAVVSALLGRAYQRRITAEEQLLRRELSPYLAYIERTKKLVPFVW